MSAHAPKEAKEAPEKKSTSISNAEKIEAGLPSFDMASTSTVSIENHAYEGPFRAFQDRKRQ
jgi:hypothetical protein